MSNRIHRLWPVEYWQNKKQQFMAATRGGELWLAGGLGMLAILFAFTVAAGIMTAKPIEEARHIPLRPLPEERLLPARTSPEEPIVNVNKPLTVKKQAPEAKPAAPEQWPIIGAIKLEYGWQQHPVLKDWRFHNGVDISAELGQAVVSAIAGTVANISRDPKTGLTVKITGDGWQVYHGSLGSATVKPGDKVASGQVIGTAGESFQEPYPHVHLVIEKNGEYINPFEVLPPVGQ